MTLVPKRGYALVGIGAADVGSDVFGRTRSVSDAVEHARGIDHYVVQGDSVDVLSEAGWVFGPGGSVRLGQEVSIEVDSPAPGSDPTKIAADAPPEVIRFVRNGRVVFGIEVTLTDGRKLPLKRKE